MKQYNNHLHEILNSGTQKNPAREGMPYTISLFGYQNRYNLKHGFPIVTTKKVNFKHIVVELLWFLRNDTNIKFMVDKGCNIWLEDSFNYYKKRCKEDYVQHQLTFEQFTDAIKGNDFVSTTKQLHLPDNYNLGDTGQQYPLLWRDWGSSEFESNGGFKGVDQIKKLIDGLKSSPFGRRHIITAWNPSTLDDMALNACHAFVQFNCREIDHHIIQRELHDLNIADLRLSEIPNYIEKNNIPRYYLDCQLYQRSADMFLGVPYNIASYALFTQFISKMTNMVAGDFIHSFGDSHIYENHLEQINIQLTRDPEKYKLPNLVLSDNFYQQLDKFNQNNNIDEFIKNLIVDDFTLDNYQSYPAIKGKLSTGLK